MTIFSFRDALEDILGVSRGGLQDSDSRESVKTWSSIADVQILAMIASETGVEPEADVVQAETVGDLLRVLEERNAFSA